MPDQTSIWILVSLICLSLSVTGQPPKSPESKVQTWNPEYEFVNSIGKFCTSRNGKRHLPWPVARAASKRNEDLSSFSKEIHKQAHKSRRNMKVKDAGFETGTIKFLRPDLKPMSAEIIKFKVFKNGGLGIGYRWFFVTRGPRDDCVYYLWLLNERNKLYQVGNNVPVCGVRWTPRWNY